MLSRKPLDPTNRSISHEAQPGDFMWPGWTRPARQHDAGEFLPHLCQRTDCEPLRGGWEARKHRGRAYEVLDEQFTRPHVRLPLQRPFQIQEAIQHWHNQDAMHAFTHAPELLILQISRFLHTDRSIRKTRQSFDIQRHLEVPTFVDPAGTVEQQPYKLCGGVLHIGKVL